MCSPFRKVKIYHLYADLLELIWNISSSHTLRYKHIWLQRCVYTHSLSVESTQSLLPSGLPSCPGWLPACQPVTQFAQDLHNLPTAQDCPGPYNIVIQVSILWGPTQAHIFLLSWHSSRMPCSITNFAWSILQLTVEFINNSNRYQQR